jgi:hypothetical protein
MRRLALACLLALLGAAVFAPAAVAQMDDDRMKEDDMMMNSASASASAMDDEMMSASAMDKKMNKKNDERLGEPAPPHRWHAPAASAVGWRPSLMAGSGLLAAGLVRRSS